MLGKPRGAACGHRSKRMARGGFGLPPRPFCVTRKARVAAGDPYPLLGLGLPPAAGRTQEIQLLVKPGKPASGNIPVFWVDGTLDKIRGEFDVNPRREIRRPALRIT